MGRLEEPIRRCTYDDAFKQSVAALRDAEIPFACMGSLALWALGGPIPNLQQDLDFAVCEEDVPQVREALASAGFTIEVPPEDWLVKAWSNGVDADDSALVDIIFRPSGLEISHELLARCERRSVLALDVPVMDATDLMVTKLHSITEQNADYTSTLQFARSVRELVDWDQLCGRVSDTPFGAVGIMLAEQLGIVPGHQPSFRRSSRRGVDAPEPVQLHAAPSPADPSDEADEHLAARIGQAIASDEHSAALDVVVDVHDRYIVLRGDAANPRHRSDVERIVRRIAPTFEVDNRLEVRTFGAPSGSEVIG